MRHANCTPLKAAISRPPMPPRTSWWLDVAERVGFTDLARQKITPEERVVYKWRDNNDD